MTKSLNTLWLAVGLVALWLGVTPNPAGPVASRAAATAPAVEVRGAPPDDVNLQELKVRKHPAQSSLATPTRNPFRFGKTRALEAPPPAVPVTAPAPEISREPSFTLAGIATEGQTRTAIISGEGQLYLVKQGGSVSDRFRVVAVESDAVTLVDPNGVQTRLVLAGK
jgi:hypothetical protein